ncbi:MAG: ribonuclease P protein component [bacterium]|nr:ribonuclease P protein component [bacterium]
MLPQKNRLLSRRDFETVKGKGVKFQTNLFGLIVCPTEKDNSRFGFIISTKISKKATERNLIKRRLREVFREFLTKIQPGYDIVVLGKKDLLTQSFDQIKKTTEEVLVKAKIVEDK